MNPFVIIPGLATLLFTCFEMPHNIKKVFFKVPTWVSSTTIAIIVGTIARGVLGPMTGFATELILFPGLCLAKKHFKWKEQRIANKGKAKKVRVGTAKKNGKTIHAVEVDGQAFEVRHKKVKV